ncbi:MAG: hypothetical protein M3P51_07360 [Chloroflexota bacterium]|nr:hypothetical protein [Chloroflexota bacterium]
MTEGSAVRLHSSRYSRDALAVLLLVLLTAVVGRSLVRPTTAVWMDTATQYYPWYAYLGERLRAGDLPMWNPYQFSGTPFLADPFSGWGYVPVMLLFTALPIGTAAAGHVLFHLLFAMLSVYCLARVLGLRVVARLVAALAYALNGFFFERNVCCVPFASVMAWLPLTLLGAEKAIRASRGLPRALWWAFAGFAYSQIASVWIGQGAYYGMLCLGGYVAYRTLLGSPSSTRGWLGRFRVFGLHLGGILVFAFGLSASGLLPRFEYNAVSNLANGYVGTLGARNRGWQPRDWWRMLSWGNAYLGGTVLLLALLAPVLARTRKAAPFFAVLSLGTLILTLQSPTPLHHLLYVLLPRFRDLQPHGAERILMLYYLGTAMLAGISVHYLGEQVRGRARFGLVAAAGASIMILSLLLQGGLSPPDRVLVPRPMLLLALVTALVILLPLVPRTACHAPVLLLLVVGTDMLLGVRGLMEARAGMFQKVDLEEYFQPSPAGRFLLERKEEGPPFRYLGFAPRIWNGAFIAYSNRWNDPQVRPLEVNADPVMLGLQDVQGYNAVHLARYDDVIAAINGQKQDYHDAAVYGWGIGSPLFPLLNARYVVTPSQALGKQDDVRRLQSALPTAWEEGRVRVLEYEQALPRAWLVHAARQAEEGKALEPLTSGQVSPGREVVLEQSPPPLGTPQRP